MAKVSGENVTVPQHDVKKVVYVTGAVTEGHHRHVDREGLVCYSGNGNNGDGVLLPMSHHSASRLSGNRERRHSDSRDGSFAERGIDDVISRQGTDGVNVSSFTRVIRGVQGCPRTVVALLDFSQFRNPMFVLFIIYSVFGNIVNSILDYLPALVQQKGLSESQAALLLGIYGGLDLVCRVSCAVIAHINKVRMTTLTMVTAAIVAVLMQFVRFMTKFEHFLVLVVLHGLLGGVGNCMFTVLVIEFVGLDSMAKCIGWNQLICGVSMAFLYPLLGKWITYRHKG